MKSSISSAECGRREIIHPASSRLLRLLALILHAVALLLLFIIDLNFLILLILAGAIIFSLRQFFVSEKYFSHGLSLQQGAVLLFQENSDSAWQEARVLESFVCRWLIVVTISSLQDSRRHTLVFAVDAINAMSYRRLMVFLNQPG